MIEETTKLTDKEFLLHFYAAFILAALLSNGAGKGSLTEYEALFGFSKASAKRMLEEMEKIK